MNKFIHLLDSTLHMPAGVADDDDDVTPAKSRSRINGATYVKNPAPGPQVVVDDVDAPREPDPMSPSRDPQFAYPQATGHIVVPSESSFHLLLRLLYLIFSHYMN